MDRESVKQFKEIEELRTEQAAKLKKVDEQGGAVNKDCRDFARFVQGKRPAVFAALMTKFKNACPSVWNEYIIHRKARKEKRKRRL